MGNITVPQCGTSDKRNKEYESIYTPKLFYSHLVPTMTPVIFDIGAHKGESVDMMRVLEHGLKVRMVLTNYKSQAVDTKEDLEKVENHMKRNSIND